MLTAEYIDVMLSVAVCLGAGLLFRFSLSVAGQAWVRTYHHTLTYLLLPVITLVITKVITGNIALSLGMIGALSIVRFRNPVKNPLELVIFFALLSIGIAAGVSLKWAILLTSVTICVVIGAHALEKYLTSRGLSLFSLSFDEGLPMTLLEISSDHRIDELDVSSAVQVYTFTSDSNLHSYKLAFRRRDEANKVKESLSTANINNLQIRYHGQ